MKQILIKYAIIYLVTFFAIQILGFLDGYFASSFLNGNLQMTNLKLQIILVLSNLILNIVVFIFINNDMAKSNIQNRWIKILTLVSRTAGILMFVVSILLQNQQIQNNESK